LVVVLIDDIVGSEALPLRQDLVARFKVSKERALRNDAASASSSATIAATASTAAAAADDDDDDDDNGGDRGRRCGRIGGKRAASPTAAASATFSSRSAKRTTTTAASLSRVATKAQNYHKSSPGTITFEIPFTLPPPAAAAGSGRVDIQLLPLSWVLECTSDFRQKKSVNRAAEDFLQNITFSSSLAEASGTAASGGAKAGSRRGAGTKR
jgi:hypothetical protein